MDLAELKAKHPDLFKAVHDGGIVQERARVLGHVKAGAASGAGEIACRNVLDGTEFDAAAQGDYFAASLDRREVTSRVDDEEHLTGLTNAKTKSAVGGSEPDADAISAAVWGQVRENLDIKVEA